MLVLGTGIGGGIILNGKVLMGAHAAAGEVSGLVSDISKMADDDFKLTSVERYSEAPLWAGMASASGLIFEYARQKHLPTGSPMPTGEEIFAAYNAGEPEAQKALKIFARRVAVGILSLQNVLDVERWPSAAVSAQRRLCCLRFRPSWIGCLSAAQSCRRSSRSWCAATMATMPT